MKKLSELPLRDRKHAKTKLALMNNAVKLLEFKTLDEISVKEICDSVMISEGTFFNYFSKKSDLLIYFIKLWTIEVIWRARKNSKKHKGLKVIETVFELTFSGKTIGNFGLMNEIIAYFARLRESVPNYSLTLAEKLMAFPDLKGIEEIEEGGLNIVFIPFLMEAVELGELPPNTDINLVSISLSSIFLGVPLIMKDATGDEIVKMYLSQLSILWAGLNSQK